MDEVSFSCVWVSRTSGFPRLRRLFFNVVPREMLSGDVSAAPHPRKPQGQREHCRLNFDARCFRIHLDRVNSRSQPYSRLHFPRLASCATGVQGCCGFKARGFATATTKAQGIANEEALPSSSKQSSNSTERLRYCYGGDISIRRNGAHDVWILICACENMHRLRIINQMRSSAAYAP